MANVPENLHYSKDHEWVRVEGDTAVIGITDHAQDQLGDVVYVELPRAGDEFVANESFGSVESVKAVSEIFTPVSARLLKPTIRLRTNLRRSIKIHTATVG